MCCTQHYRNIVRIAVLLIVFTPGVYAQLEIKLNDGKTLQGKIVSESEATITLRTFLQKRQEYTDIVLDKANIVQVYDIINDADVSGKYRVKSNSPATVVATPQGNVPEPSKLPSEEGPTNFKTTERSGSNGARGRFAFGMAGGYSTVSQDDWNRKFIEAELMYFRSLGWNAEGESATSGYPLSAFLLFGLSRHLQFELAGMFLKVNSHVIGNDILYSSVTGEFIPWNFEEDADFYHVDGSVGVRIVESIKADVFDVFVRVTGGIAYSRYDRKLNNVYVGQPSQSQYIIDRAYAYIPFGRLGVGLEYHAGITGLFAGAGYRYVVPRDVDEHFTVLTRINKDGEGNNIHSSSIPLDYDMSGWELMLGIIFYL